MRIFLFVAVISLFTFTVERAEAADFGFAFNFGNSGRNALVFGNTINSIHAVIFRHNNRCGDRPFIPVGQAAAVHMFSNYRGSQRSYSQSRQRFRSHNNLLQ